MLSRGGGSNGHSGLTAARASEPIDRHWRSFAPLPRDTGTRRSLYLTMRDGVQLALDVHLPTSARFGERLPTIVRQTRYFRSVELPRPLDFRMSRDAFDIAAPTRERFLARGYAWVDVDVRGSGVSSGSWPLPWSRDEVRDGAEVVDFIVRQPWSNGLVGATGISYEGTTAEMLLVNQHDAVRAIAPRFSLFCAYEDVAYPGGAHLSWFTEGWARFNRLLDDHRFHDAMAELIYVIARGHAAKPDALLARSFRALLDRLGPARTKRIIGSALGAVFQGGRRVDGDDDGALRARALRAHIANGDIHALCLEASFRDDCLGANEELAFRAVSPRDNLAAIAASGAAVYGYGGYFDGAYAQAAARRFASLGRTRLLLGPWGHAGVIAHQPFAPAQKSAFAHDAELLRFFDLHLRNVDDGLGSEPNVAYFTLGENRWRTASEWPPKEAHVHRQYLSAARGLGEEPPALDDAFVSARSNARFGTGERSRWRGVLAAFVPADYPDLQTRIRGEVCFDSVPLAKPRTVTGHPAVTLFVRSHAPDFLVMVYLVDVAPDGTLAYVTEGQLRALHRRECAPERGFIALTPHHSFLRAHTAPLGTGETAQLGLGLLPTSYRFQAGHRVRLVVTLGDCDHFASPGPSNVEVAIMTCRSHPSSLDLPWLD